VLGTPYYMSPEQERGEKVGKQADVYALGILLAEMTSGELPKPGARVEQGSCLQNTPCVNKIPEGLRQLVFSNTDVDPTRRPADAAEALKLFRSEMAKSVGA